MSERSAKEHQNPGSKSWDVRIPDASVIPKYKLDLSPLTRHPRLIDFVEQSLSLSLEAILFRPLCMHAAALAASEMVGNLLAHADWDAACPPEFRAWIGVRTDTAELNLETRNLVMEPGVVDNIREAAKLCDDTAEAMRAIASRLFEMGGESIHETSSGIGLLQIAASGRCRISAELDSTNDRLLTVRVVIPLLDKSRDVDNLYERRDAS